MCEQCDCYPRRTLVIVRLSAFDDVHNEPALPRPLQTPTRDTQLERVILSLNLGVRSNSVVRLMIPDVHKHTVMLK
jgi:hypothetical protein